MDEDFLIDPNNTFYMLLTPKIPQATWWPHLRSYKLVHTYPVGSLIFTIRKDESYNHEVLQDAGDEGGADRVFIKGTPFETCVFIRDRYTPITVDDNVLFHLRYGHMSAEYLAKAVERCDPQGLDVTPKSLKYTGPLCMCQACVFAKMHKPGPHSPVPATARSQVSMEHFSCDIMGPVDPPSFRDERFLIAFTCDYSRFTYCAPMQRKSDSTSVLQAFNEDLIQRGMRRPSISIRVDNDKALKDGEFLSYAKSHAIVITRSQPYIPETNSRAETVWKSLQYIANAQLFQSSLDASYWTLSYMHAVDLRNNMPHRAIDFKAPVEKAFGTTPDLQRIYIWGSPCFVWVPSKLRKKLDPKARPGIYVGRARDSKN